MIGHPRYKYGDVVKFKINDKEFTGFIYVIDYYGTFEDHSEVSYDIMTQNCLYKHIRENFITDFIMSRPIIDNRIVCTIGFANNLKEFLKSVNTDNPDDEKMRDFLSDIADELLKYQRYTCTDKDEQIFLNQID